MVEVPARVQKHTRPDGLEYTLPCSNSLLVMGFRIGAAIALLSGIIGSVMIGLSPLRGLAILLFALPLIWLTDRGLVPAARVAARGTPPTLAVVLALSLLPSALGMLLDAVTTGAAIGVFAASTWAALSLLGAEHAHIRIEPRGFVLRTGRGRGELRVAFSEISKIGRIALTRRWQDIIMGRRGSKESATLGLDLSAEEAAWLAHVLRQHLNAWRASTSPPRTGSAEPAAPR